MEFTLPDMTCGHCASVVTRALKEADPGCRLLIDLPTRRIGIDSRLDDETLRATLTEAGYAPARAIPAGLDKLP